MHIVPQTVPVSFEVIFFCHLSHLVPPLGLVPFSAAHQPGKNGAELGSTVDFFPWGVQALMHTRVRKDEAKSRKGGSAGSWCSRECWGVGGEEKVFSETRSLTALQCYSSLDDIQ